MMNPISDTAIRAALTYIPPDDRDIWVRVGMALKSEMDDAGFDLFDQWSQGAENFNAKAVKSTWKSFKAGGGVTIASLIAEAKQRGFDPKQYAPAAPLPEAERERAKREQAERERLANVELEAKQEAAAHEAATLWAAASIEGESPYLVRKQVAAHGVRFSGDTVMVPLCDADGKLRNVQRIFANGDKRFLAGGRVSGCFHMIGSLHHQESASPWLLIAEGYATAATLHAATGYPVAVAFNANNIKHVARLMRTQHPHAKLLLCADDDHETELVTGKNPGIAAAMETAKDVNGVWCKPVGLEVNGTDFNDFAISNGLDAVRAQVTAIIDAAIADKATDSPATTIDAHGQGVDNPKPKKEEKATATTKAKAKTVKGGGNGSASSEGHSTRPFFTVDQRGVWYHGFSQQGDPLPAQWICSPLRVTAKSRDAGNGEWGYLLEFEDGDRMPKRWAMPASMLAGDGTQFRSTLLAMGLQIGTSAQAKNQLAIYIQTQQTDVRVRCTDRIGWHDDVYVLPDRTIGEGEEMVMFQSPGGVVSQFKQRGTLEQWRDHVAAHCQGNSRMVFCVSAAFAAPLLHHSGVSSGGFHIWGDSSSGKSTAFKVAGSVYGGKDYPRNWRMTDNALEMVAAQHSDALLLLDEIAQVDPKVVGDTVYMLANETGKGRATQTATARRTHTWRVLFLSDGEVSLANHMSEAGKGARGGHDVRMAHIGADAGKGYGVYDTLHDFADGAALSNHLVSMAQQYYGVAGMAFIERAVNSAGTLSDTLRAKVSKITQEICPPNAHGQVSRVASRFALVGVAGEMASKAGITGWPQGEALAAARTCFAAWLEGRGGAGNTEHGSIIRQVSGFFQLHGDARFVWWHRATDDRKPNTMNRAGFKRLLTKDGAPISSNSDHHKEFGDIVHPQDAEGCELEYFVLPEVFKSEMCKGFSPKAVANLLIERGLLMPEGAGERVRADRKERLPGMGSARCYRFSPKIVGVEV
jgi:putative DNA primase/helicase